MRIFNFVLFLLVIFVHLVVLNSEMSTKHLRRLLEEKEAQKKAQEGENKEHNSEDEDDVSDVPKGGPKNRFAFLSTSLTKITFYIQKF